MDSGIKQRGVLITNGDLRPFLGRAAVIDVSEIGAPFKRIITDGGDGGGKINGSQ